MQALPQRRNHTRRQYRITPNPRQPPNRPRQVINTSFGRAVHGGVGSAPDGRHGGCVCDDAGVRGFLPVSDRELSHIDWGSEVYVEHFELGERSEEEGRSGAERVGERARYQAESDPRGGVNVPRTRERVEVLGQNQPINLAALRPATHPTRRVWLRRVLKMVVPVGNSGVRNDDIHFSVP